MSATPDVQKARLIRAGVAMPAGMVIGRALLALACGLCGIKPATDAILVSVIIGAAIGAVVTLVSFGMYVDDLGSSE